MPRWIFLTIVLFFLFPLPVLALTPSVSNPIDPPIIETWQLREVWRLDNDEDMNLPLMGIINQAVVGDDGHLLLLDAQMAHILEISPEGEFIQTLGRMGQGPGELERPNTLFLLSNGQLGLVQVFPGKIVLLNRDGTPGGDVTAQGENPMIYWAGEAAGHLVIGGKTMGFEPSDGSRVSHNYLRQLTWDGEPLHNYLQSTEKTQYDPPAMNEKDTWFPHRSWAMTADGSILLAPERDEYRIEWLEPGGEVRRLITREFSAYKRNAQDRKTVLDRMRMWNQSGEIQPKKTILDTDPAINRIRVLKDGRIWVRSCFAEKELPDRVHCRYDVFDDQGHLQSEVRIAYPVDRELDYFTLLDDGRFLLFLNGASVLDSFFASTEEAEGEILERSDGEGDSFQVILLERAP